VWSPSGRSGKFRACQPAARERKRNEMVSEIRIHGRVDDLVTRVPCTINPLGALHPPPHSLFATHSHPNPTSSLNSLLLTRGHKVMSAAVPNRVLDALLERLYASLARGQAKISSRNYLAANGVMPREDASFVPVPPRPCDSPKRPFTERTPPNFSSW
jgi:hypothetical protein